MSDIPDPRVVLDQFARQAAGFAAAPAMRDRDALQLLLDLTTPAPEDELLDVACGPGLVVCAFAPHVRTATGIDLTPAMIDQARALQSTQGHTNVHWQVGPASPLPWPDATFTIVTSRYAFHHFPDPASVLGEMLRVAAPGARLAIIDVVVSPDPVRAAAYNRMERWRDPAHVRALALAEFESLFQRYGLREHGRSSYRLELELETLLRGSFPNPGDADKVRALVHASLEEDRLGVEVWRDEGQVRLAYPITAFVLQKPASASPTLRAPVS